MREIKIEGGKRNVRGLSVAEIKEMEGNGYPINRWRIELTGLETDADAGKMFEEILEKAVIDPIDFSTLTPADERRLFFGIIAETFGSGEEEKNLLKSGDSAQTPKE